MKTVPGPVSFSRMNPSPPKNPAPSRFTMAILSCAVDCATTKLSRCTKNALAGFQIEGLDASGITAREADFAGGRGAEVSHEQRFAHELALHRAPELFAQSFAGHARFPGHLGLLVEHLAGFGEQLLAGLQADANHLKIVALDGVVQRLMDGTCEEPAEVAFTGVPQLVQNRPVSGS